MYLYPTPESGFYVKGGLGFGYINARASSGSVTVSATETGFGGILGLGIDIRLGDNFSLTPFGNLLFNRVEGETFNIVQAGLGFTFH